LEILQKVKGKIYTIKPPFKVSFHNTVFEQSEKCVSLLEYRNHVIKADNTSFTNVVSSNIWTWH
jgi:hypothetical protein